MTSAITSRIKALKMPFTPSKKGPRRKETKYPFATMRVGESFLVPAGTVKWRSMCAYVCQRSAALTPKKFVIAKLESGEFQVYRKN